MESVKQYRHRLNLWLRDARRENKEYTVTLKEENRRFKEELQDLREEMEEELSEAVHLLRHPTFSSASFIKKHSGET